MLHMHTSAQKSAQVAPNRSLVRSEAARELQSPDTYLASARNALGNQALLRTLRHSQPTIQRKLTVNQPGDVYEQEADRVADHVMRMSAPVSVQRQCPTCEQEEKLQRKCEHCEEEEKNMQRRESGTGPEVAPPIVNDVLSSSGQPLDTATRAFFEPRFSRDFSQVRVHTGEKAAESARAVNALAYTVGNHMVFSADQRHDKLLAHELVHVMQQTGASTGNKVPAQPTTPISIQRQPKPDPGGAPKGPSPAAKPPAAPPKIAKPCDMPEVFTKFGDSFFHGAEVKSKDKWNAELDAAIKPKPAAESPEVDMKKENPPSPCHAMGKFPDATLAWDMGNPNLGSALTVNLNQDSKTMGIEVHVVYPKFPCCDCFAGTLDWDLTLKVTRTSSSKKKTESGTAEIKGSQTSEKCPGGECCTIDQTGNVGLLLDSNKIPGAALVLGGDRVTLETSGPVNLKGSTFRNPPLPTFRTYRPRTDFTKKLVQTVDEGL